ncbi:aldehyde dehydrogenase family protein, partial [Geminicoccus sp.]|uniref:aldehyde dehydrogenase family protein n=1 Tax=Geminicoccus sp. TaxID=2024832 RepID=UPI0039C86965
MDKVTSTGSTEVGKRIVKAAAGKPKRVSLEVGGKSPRLIFPNARLDHTIVGTARCSPEGFVRRGAFRPGWRGPC